MPFIFTNEGDAVDLLKKNIMNLTFCFKFIYFFYTFKKILFIFLFLKKKVHYFLRPNKLTLQFVKNIFLFSYEIQIFFNKGWFKKKKLYYVQICFVFKFKKNILKLVQKWTIFF